jgi:hypothetical protein
MFFYCVVINCFTCLGVRQECVEERRYVNYGDDGNCIYSAIAKGDLAKLNAGETGAITLRTMLEEYLASKGDARASLI